MKACRGSFVFFAGFSCVILGEFFLAISLFSIESEARHGSTHMHESCDKEQCAPKLSYCMVSGHCYCNATEKDCLCCAECKFCLAELFDSCCNCIGICNSTDFTGYVPTMTSTVGFLEDPNEELFRTLTDEPVSQLKYTIVKFPVIEELAFHHHKRPHTNQDQALVVDQLPTHDSSAQKHYLLELQKNLKNMVDFDTKLDLCTVSYSDTCIAMQECTMYCSSMGANSFRWFHNGCCECVGPSCLNHGNQYPKCKECWR